METREGCGRVDGKGGSLCRLRKIGEGLCAGVSLPSQYQGEESFCWFPPLFHNGLSTPAPGIAFDSLGSKGKGKAGAQ